MKEGAMSTGESQVKRGLGLFEKYLTVRVILCLGAGILLGKIAPGAARFLDGLSVFAPGGG
jgi:ACR3 family arsenite transporter